MASKKAAPPGPKWWGQFTINIVCSKCGGHATAKRLLSGEIRPFASSAYIKGKWSKCTHDMSQDAMLPTVRTSYATAVKADIRKRTSNRYHSNAPSDTAVEVLAAEYNDTPGLNDLETLFMLFRDVLRFLVSDSLWRAVAVQSAAEALAPATSRYTPAQVKWALAQLESFGTENTAAARPILAEVAAITTTRARDSMHFYSYRRHELSDYGLSFSLDRYAANAAGTHPDLSTSNVYDRAVALTALFIARGIGEKAWASKAALTAARAGLRTAALNAAAFYVDVAAALTAEAAADEAPSAPAAPVDTSAVLVRGKPLDLTGEPIEGGNG